MGSAYRSDLEAAALRADALTRENRELRRRIARGGYSLPLGVVGWTLVTIILLSAVALGSLLAASAAS